MMARVTNKHQTQRINQLLIEWSAGKTGAKDEIIKNLYPELHRMARKHFKSQNANSIQTTEVVNEAFIKLSNNTHDWQSKAHFLCIASKIIRSIVVDHYRASQSLKRGGNLQHMTIDRMDSMIENPQGNAHDWLDLDQLLKLLEKKDQTSAQVVELKVFGGLTIPEIACCLNISKSSVARNWSFARSWLLMQLK